MANTQQVLSDVPTRPNYKWPAVEATCVTEEGEAWRECQCEGRRRRCGCKGGGGKSTDRGSVGSGIWGVGRVQVLQMVGVYKSLWEFRVGDLRSMGGGSRRDVGNGRGKGAGDGG